MSEDPKLFDAGDYNLFRYCHNDPVDLTDPTGLQDTVETSSPQQTSQLREAVQEGLRQAAHQRAYATAYSRANFEGGRSFIGTGNFHMAQTTVQGGVPARYVPTLNTTGHQRIEDGGYFKDYQWQLVDSKGHPFKAGDLVRQEVSSLKQGARLKACGN